MPRFILELSESGACYRKTFDSAAHQDMVLGDGDSAGDKEWTKNGRRVFFSAAVLAG